MKACAIPEPLMGLTERELNWLPGAITSHTPGPSGIHGPEDCSVLLNSTPAIGWPAAKAALKVTATVRLTAVPPVPFG